MKDNQAKYPQLRFKGFTDPWEKRNLGDITAWTKGQGLPKEDLNEEKSGLEAVHYADLYKFSPVMHEVIHWTNSDDGRVIPNNSLLFPASDVTPVGLARTSTLKLSGVKAGGDVIIGQLDESIDSSFMSYQINATSKKILPLITGTTVKHVQAKSLATLSVSVTNMAEQTAIAGLFERIDKLIAANQRKLDLLKEQKKGYLQKLFPKNGSKFPQLRFAGFADAWEERKFEDLLDSKDGVRRGPFGSALKKEFFVENSEYVVYEQQNAIYDNYHTRYKITKEKFDELSKFKLNPGDFIMSGAGTIGRISRVPDGVKLGVFNQALIRFRINPEITDSEYFIQFVRADFMQKNLTGANPGSAITNLVPMSEVKKWEIKAPHLEEQEKIGSFFKLLDDTIALHQRKLEKLQELKKGYLQKMFC